MSAFVLPHHSTNDALHGMLDKFRHRLAEKPHSAQLSVMYEALQKRTGVSANSHHYLIYWPLTPEAFNTKRCLYEKEVSSLICTPKSFHFIYITSLLQKIHPKKNRYRSCKCKDHAKRIPLDWSEFVYPQFIELLFKRAMTPSKCPSPIAAHAIQLTNESLQCRFEIERQASFLNQVCHLSLSTFSYSNSFIGRGGAV